MKVHPTNLRSPKPSHLLERRTSAAEPWAGPTPAPAWIESGFSLLELLITLAVVFIVAGIGMPRMVRVINTVQVRGSAESVSVLLQKARMQAVKDNKFYTVIPNGTLGLTNRACVDLNWSHNCTNGDFAIQLASNVSFTTAGPSTLVITCGPSPLTTVCPGGYTGLNFAAQPAATVLPSFNARGLPCVNNPPSTEPTWPTDRCFNNDPSNVNAAPVGFLYTLKLASPLGDKYAAVVVTPASRILVYTYEGPDANGVDVWVR